MRVVDILNRLPVAVRNKFQPIRDSHLAICQKRDPQDNASTTPPEDERIDLCCAWGIEFYTPTHIPDLIKGFRKLGWNTDDLHDPSRDPESWLYGLRRFQHGGAWMNLGYLIPKDSGRSLSGADQRVAPLPPCAKYASAGIYSISPSLISVVVCFVFNDDTSTMFDKALRTNRQTYTTPIRRGHQIHNVRTLKADHIRQIRTNINRQIGSWFSQNLAGLFSSGILDHDIPTCEFITLKKAEPFPSQIEGENNFQEYLDLLGITRDFDVWESSGTPGLKFRMPNYVERNPRYHSILAIKEDRHIDGMPDFYGGTDRYARIVHVDQVMPKLLSLWSILPMLEGYTQHLNMVRDLATSQPRSRLAPAKVLERLEGNVAYSVDIAAVTAELAMYSEEGFPLVHDVEQFEPCDSRLYEGVDLRKRLKVIVYKQVTWLERTDKSIRDQQTQYGTLLGTKENVRLQRKIQNLTRVLVILTIVVLLAALVPEELKQDMLSFVKRFWPM